MDVQYSPEIRNSAEAFALVEQASALLKDILGAHASQPIKAAWSCVRDQQGRVLYRLVLRDSVGEASTDFALDELRIPLHVRFRMSRLWGDLLQVRNNLQHQEVQALSSELITG